MSVTFTVLAPIVGWTAHCACGAAEAADRFGDYADATDAIRGGLLAPACGDEYCAADTIWPVAVTAHPDAPVANLSNANARFVLDALGLSVDELCGTISGADLLGRVLVSEAISPADAGVPATVMIRGTGPTVHNCGRRPGYLQDQLARLRDLAQYAAAHHLPVTWA